MDLETIYLNKETKFKLRQKKAETMQGLHLTKLSDSEFIDYLIGKLYE